MVSRARHLGPFGLFLLAGCAHAPPRFPARDVVRTDGDDHPVSVACRIRPTTEDPRHVTCAPEPYVSPLAWDAIDNSIFRPIAKTFAVDPPAEAPDVNALDEVPDSAWFENRLGVRHPSRDELLRGACTPDDVLDPRSAAPGSWRIDHGKDNGASLGFRVRVGTRKYMFKTDEPTQPERPSAASAIGAAIYHAVGFNTSCEQVVYVDRSVFTLSPGLTVTNNAGVTRPFDEAALANVFAHATKSGAQYRMQASAWLPGYLLGPFRYEGTRGDDPNDVIPHEDRRDLRGARVLAAWIDHVDAREQNSMDTWITAGGAPDASPGYVRHYYLDTSDSLGTEWAWDGVSRRLGDSYLLDWGDIGEDFLTFGVPTREWETKERARGYEQFGYFRAEGFDPDGWKNEYPNPAFGRATERDDAWMARILSRFDRADIGALVSIGKLSNDDQATHLADVLEGRLEKILARYLTRLSPIADVTVEGESTLCATDLARRRNVRPAGDFRYTATWSTGERAVPIRVEAQPEGRVCMALPRAGAGDYVVVTIANGASRFPLRAHLYDFGPRDGYRLAGLERSEAP